MRHPLFAAAAALLALSAAPVFASPLTFDDVWIREAPPAADVQAAYMTIKNPSNMMLRIIGVSSEDFDSGELHHMATVDGKMTMRTMPNVDIAPTRTVSFAPGGDHIMLLKPHRKLKAGDKVKLHLKLSNGETIDIEAAVRK